MCIDSEANMAHYGKSVSLYPCHGQAGNQVTCSGKIVSVGSPVSSLHIEIFVWEFEYVFIDKHAFWVFYFSDTV